MNQVADSVKRLCSESKVIAADFFKTMRQELRMKNYGIRSTEMAIESPPDNLHLKEK